MFLCEYKGGVLYMETGVGWGEYMGQGSAPPPGYRKVFPLTRPVYTPLKPL